jgi:ABC-type sulfate/molybdate transport systems ATPase subunit
MRAGLGDIIKSAAAFSSVVVTGHEISDFSRWAKRFIVLKDGVIEKEVVVREEDRSSAVSEVTQALLEKEARL